MRARLDPERQEKRDFSEALTRVPPLSGGAGSGGGVVRLVKGPARHASSQQDSGVPAGAGGKSLQLARLSSSGPQTVPDSFLAPLGTQWGVRPTSCSQGLTGWERDGLMDNLSTLCWGSNGGSPRTVGA